MIIATVASNSINACAEAARGSKSCRSRRSPPANIDTPSTSRTLPRIDPTMEALTTSCSPAPSANSAMISSGALPKVTLRNPPIPGPDRAASSSVARPISAAVGITPSAEARNTQVAPAWMNSSTTATGISGTSRYGQPSPVSRKGGRCPAGVGADVSVAIRAPSRLIRRRTRPPGAPPCAVSSSQVKDFAPQAENSPREGPGNSVDPRLAPA
jgi:hypothetical protein